MQNIIEFLQKTIGLSPGAQKKLLISGFIVLILWFIRFLTLKIVWRRTEDVRIRYIWRRTITYTVSILGIIFIGRVYLKSFGQIGTFLGLLSAGLAVAMKDPIVNIVGWSFIIIRKPFEVGDRIQIGNQSGDVIDIRLFQFTLMEIGNWVNADQSTGRIIHIPNGKVFTDIIANYNKGFQYIWDEISVLITFESNWQKAKDILLKIVHKHTEHLTKSAEKKVKEASKRFLIFYSYLTPFVYTSVKESGILLTLRYLCEPRKRRNTEHEIWEDILKEFSKNEDIAFAYPTQSIQLKKEIKSE